MSKCVTSSKGVWRESFVQTEFKTTYSGLGVLGCVEISIGFFGIMMTAIGLDIVINIEKWNSPLNNSIDDASYILQIGTGLLGTAAVGFAVHLKFYVSFRPPPRWWYDSVR